MMLKKLGWKRKIKGHDDFFGSSDLDLEVRVFCGLEIVEWESLFELNRRL